MILKDNKDVDKHQIINGKFDKTIESNDMSTNTGSQITSNTGLNHLKDNNINNETVDPNSDKPFTLQIEINSIAWLLFMIAFAFRFYRLDEPASIVSVIKKFIYLFIIELVFINYFNLINYRFDELHYGKFVSLYLKGIFFFDSQPPLGKQLISLSAYIAGYKGDNTFSSIGGSESYLTISWTSLI
jgi:dolichyl-phosphate-mannose--protein O-mannosyl transferase